MTRRWGLLLAIVALGVILASLPMRLALSLAGADQAGVSARGVTGSIWSGRLTDANWHGASLGDIDAGLAPLALLRGNVRLDFARQDALRGDLTGALLLAGGQGVSDVTGAISLGANLAGVPLDTLRLNGVTAHFDRSGRCVEAAGTAQLLIMLPIPGLDLRNGLSGPLSCRNGRAEVALASQSGMEKLLVAVDGYGAWRARLAIGTASDPAMAGLLRAAGFFNDGKDLVLVRDGQL